MSGSFLQSAEWEEFQKAVGRKTWRADGVLIIKHDLSAELSYLYCPRPVDITEKFLLDIERVAKEEHSLFLKIDPLIDSKLKNLKFKASNSIQPKKTVILDLQKSEEELLRGMREKTRYNIRLAERHGVRISPRPPDVFWDLLKETAERDEFNIHEKSYYEKLLTIKSENFSNELFFAEYQGKILATALINFYKPSGAATYLHGASSRENKEVMAPHLLHWRIIQEAKKRGFGHYDLWGIDEKKWPGVTRFKLGFGGSQVEYPEATDIIYRPFWYGFYKLVRRVI